MTMIPCTNPQLCGASEHRPGTQNLKCQAKSSPQTIGALSQKVQPLSKPSTSKLSPQESRDLESYLKVSEEIDGLKSGALGPYLNYFKIQKLESSLHDLDSVRELGELGRANNTFHKENPKAPKWSHSGDFISGIGLEKDMYWFDAQTRGFDIAMGKGVALSPDHQRISTGLSSSRLSSNDQDVLRDYVVNGIPYKNRWADSELNQKWEMQQEKTSDMLSRAPRLDSPGIVWRGESFDMDDTESGRRARERVQELIELEVGSEFSFDSCVSTSTSISVAAGTFSGTVGSGYDGIQPDKSDSYYAVVFELETDRGVYVDGKLGPTVKEKEVFLPKDMRFEVVGHVQVRHDYEGSGGYSNESHHVIRLRLIPDQ